jgi:hypothetical protein
LAQRRVILFFCVVSASGDDGFWQRWSDYVRIGHRDNRILICEKRDAREADVSILEVTGSGSVLQAKFVVLALEFAVPPK